MGVPALNISTQKVGGLRFVRIGRLSLSFCLTRKPVYKATAPKAPEARFSVRPVIESRGEFIRAGLRLYRNGKLQTVRWCEEAFAMPGDAWAHAQGAALRSGLPVAR